MLFNICLGFVAILCYLHFWVYSRRPKNFPPGPSLMLPLLGNAIQLGLKCYETSFALREKYGDIIGFRVGSNWIVVLNNPHHIRDAFSKAEFSNRTGFNFLVNENIQDWNKGVGFSNGPTWVHNRQLVQKSLRDFAYANRTLEGVILDEVKSLLGRLKLMEGQEINTENLFPVHIMNITWAVVAGGRFEHDDPKVLELVDLYQTFWETISNGIGPYFFLFPQLVNIYKRFPFVFQKQGNLFREKLFTIYRQAIKEHRDTLQIGQPRDLLDTLLEDELVNNTDDEMNILTTLLDIFAAGTEIPSSVIRWACYLLAMHPHVQEKLAEEIKTAIGNTEVTLSDRSRLLYAEATMYEVHRVGCIAPVGLPRGTVTDLNYAGFRIPKDTLVVPNIYACMHSKEIWGDPENFRPERFISPDGKSLLRNNAWLPFGFGKRVCLGEALARDELFLLLTNLVLNFRFSFPSQKQCKTIDNSFVGMTRHCKDHRIVANSRF